MQTGYVVLQQRHKPLFKPERGKLYISNSKFFNEYGELFRWRGYSWFLGFHRFQQGEDVSKDIKWFKDNGVNIPRFFGPLPWAELNGSYDYSNFDFYKLDEFMSLFEKHGIRQNWSILPGEPNSQAKSFLNKFYEVAGAHWNIVAEVVNEPDHGNKIDPLDILPGTNRRGILTAYGYYPEDNGRALDNCPVLDFGTCHLPRDNQWSRKARDAKFFQDYYKKAFVSDEPAKIAEPDFQGSGVKNSWETTPREAGWHHGVAALWTPGSTVHTQHGRNGLVPEKGTLTQTAMDYVVNNVWKKFPAETQYGDYRGSHFSNSPVDGTQEPNGNPVWTYSSVDKDKAFAVRCYPSQPNAINGWTAEEYWGDYKEFVRLTK